MIGRGGQARRGGGSWVEQGQAGGGMGVHVP